MMTPDGSNPNESDDMDDEGGDSEAGFGSPGDTHVVPPGGAPLPDLDKIESPEKTTKLSDDVRAAAVDAGSTSASTGGASEGASDAGKTGGEGTSDTTAAGGTPGGPGTGGGEGGGDKPPTGTAPASGGGGDDGKDRQVNQLLDTIRGVIADRKEAGEKEKAAALKHVDLIRRLLGKCKDKDQLIKLLKGALKSGGDMDLQKLVQLLMELFTLLSNQSRDLEQALSDPVIGEAEQYLAQPDEE